MSRETFIDPQHLLLEHNCNEVVAECEALHAAKHRSTFWRHAKGSDSLRRWSEDTTAEESIELGVTGIQSETAKCQAVLDKLRVSMADTLEVQPRWDVWGSAWDMGALVAGEPECGLQFEEQPADNPVVKIVIDAFYSGGVEAKKLTARARAITALLATLNSAGYAVELDLWYAGQNSASKPKTVEHLVRVHRAGDVFDLSRIAFWAGHPAAIRMLCYPVVEKRKGAFGETLPDKPATDKKKKECADNGYLYIESAYLDLSKNKYDTPEQAAAWVSKQVDEITKRHAIN